MRAAPANNAASALVQLQAHVAGDVALGVFEEALQPSSQVVKPVAGIDQLRITTAQKFLELNHFPAMDQSFQVAMTGEQNRRAGRLVEFSTFDGEEAVFDDITAADAVFAAQSVQLSHQGN